MPRQFAVCQRSTKVKATTSVQSSTIGIIVINQPVLQLEQKTQTTTNETLGSEVRSSEELRIPKRTRRTLKVLLGRFGILCTSSDNFW